MWELIHLGSVKQSVGTRDYSNSVQLSYMCLCVYNVTCVVFLFHSTLQGRINVTSYFVMAAKFTKATCVSRKCRCSTFSGAGLSSFFCVMQMISGRGGVFYDCVVFLEVQQSPRIAKELLSFMYDTPLFIQKK